MEAQAGGSTSSVTWRPRQKGGKFMKSGISFLLFTCILFLFSCAKKESAEAPNQSAAPAEAPKPAGGPHALVHLNDGSKVPGTIVASSQTDMVVAGDDGIERRIPLTQIKSVEYGEEI